MVVGHRPLGPSRVFEKVDFDTVDSAPDENGLRLCEPTICLDFECVFDADGKSRQAEGAWYALCQGGRRNGSVAGGHRDHCATKTNAARLHNAGDAAHADGQLSAQRGPRLTRTQIGGNHLGSEAVAADADDITRWSTDAFDAPVAQGPIRCRRCRGVRELTITDGYDCPSEWAVRAADRPPERAVARDKFDFHWL